MQELSPVYKTSDGRTVPWGDAGLTPLSLATTDFNHDGYPDLLVGYAARGGGLLTVHLGNPQAFAPNTPEAVQQILKGEFPPSFQPTATAFEIGAAPDFMAAGDFGGTGKTEILFAARGGKAVGLLAADGTGGLTDQGSVPVPGAITAMAVVGHSVIVGADTGDGPALVAYQFQHLLLDPAGVVPMSASVTSITAGDLDGDRYLDAAIVAGGRLYILHGTGGASPELGDLAAVPATFAVEGVILGDFIADRGHRAEIALVAKDGSVHVMSRGQLDTRPLTREELAERRRNARSPVPQPHPAAREAWVEVRASPSGVGSRVRRLFAGHLSEGPSEDLFTVDDSGRMMTMADVQGVASASLGHAAGPLVSAVGEPIAMLPMRLNVMGSQGLVVLARGRTAPLTISDPPNITFQVTTLADSTTGTCTTPSGSPLTSTCTTLRAAVQASNSFYGQNLIAIVDYGGITLTVAGQDDTGQLGDLDITNAVTIIGNPNAGQTVIQAGTSTTNGIDKVFSFNPLGALPGFPVSISGLSLQYGRNTSTDFSVGDNEGGAFDFDASAEDGAGSLSVSNCSILQSSTVNGDGGGIALFDGGVVSIATTTISGNTANARGSTQFYGGGVFVGDSDPFPASITISASTLAGNAAPGGGGGIYAYGPGLTVSGSRFAGNTSAAGSPALDGFNGIATVSAADNWWGSNGSPAALVNTGVVTAFSPWLVLAVSATPTSVEASEPAAVTASISSGSDGSTGYQAPDGTPASFTGSLGTFTPASSGTASGAAAATFTAGTATGTATVSATVDSQTLSAAVGITADSGDRIDLKINEVNGCTVSDIPIEVDDITYVAPLTFYWARGSTHTIGVAALEGVCYFSAWSDGGSQTHTITTPLLPRTYTATFSSVQPAQ